MRSKLKIAPESGFSLVELMIVVGIIGVLATMAFPRFRLFAAKAKMAEAKTITQHIYTLQHTYAAENNTFVAMTRVGASMDSIVGNNLCDFASNTGAQALGFRIDPCLPDGPIPRYYYEVVDANERTFVAFAATGLFQANRVCPGNDHHWIGVNQDNAKASRTRSRFANNGDFANPTQLSIGDACPN